MPYVFSVRHDGWHNARFVTGGHLTHPAIESVCSSVVSIRSTHVVLLIAELTGL